MEEKEGPPANFHEFVERLRRIRLWKLMFPVTIAFLAPIVGVALWMALSFMPRYKVALLRAQVGQDVMNLAVLQERYHKLNGSYAAGLEPLAHLAADPEALRNGMAGRLDLHTLLISGTTSRFVIEANVLDKQRTLIHFEGPPPGYRP